MSRELLVPEALWRLILLLLTLAAGNLAAEGSAVAKDQTRVALVIGNEAYAEAPVPNAISDARAVADVLRQGGFDVVYVENATKSAIADAVRNFAEKTNRGGVAAVYYSGHAVQHQNRNFLVAIDSKIMSQGTVRSETFDMDLLLDPLIVSRPAGSVVIIDASRQNPWNRLVSNRQGLATQEPLTGITVIYPDAPGKVAAGHNFSSELVKAMKIPGLGLDAVMSRTRTALVKSGGKDQVVWQSSPPPKDLVLLPAEPAGKISSKASDVELGFWDTIKDSETAADFQIYLDSYPGGQFLADAQARLAQLQAKKAEPLTRSAMITPSGTALQSASPATLIRDCPLCPEMVPIPAGDFEMGATNGSPFERPVHHVSIRKPFYIGRREVTFDEWDACANEGGCPYRPAAGDSGRGLRPVTDVDWNDAKAYLTWLSAKTGHTYRLPTEAEWEFAARAGSTTAYLWGSSFEKDRANCVDCNTIALGKAVESGTFGANGFGLFDMAGNAAEWVEDCWNETYNGAPADGSAWNKPNCRERVLRGGSFNSDKRYVRSSARFKYDYDVRYYANGFRAVRE